MTTSTQQDRIAFAPISWPHGWRLVTALVTLAAAAGVIAGAFLPWVEAFAGLIPIPGVRGDNGKLLAVAGAVIAAAGLWQLAAGSPAARWLGGLTGLAASAFSGYLLITLVTTMHTLGGDSMVAARGGPGLAVTTAGSVAAFATLLLPSSSRSTFRRERGAASGNGAIAADAATPLTAHPATVPALRRGLQVSLGVLWLLDAVLQYQPVMFGKAFAVMMLAPSGAGQPFFVSGPGHLTARIVAASPAAWNAVFATIQLALGAGLLFRRTARAALAVSIAWALSVWWLGEGLGGIFSSAGSSPLTGAPGAAVLYALLALLIWPSAPRAAVDGNVASRFRACVAEAGPLGRYARLAWFVTWAVLAALMARAPFSAAPLTAGGGTPAVVITVAFTAAFCFAAAGVLFPVTTRAALITAAVAAALLWAAGENYGALFSGMATDPSSGPLLVLLALSFWPALRESAAPVPDGSAW